LDDEKLRATSAVVEPGPDLVSTLAVDSTIAKVESWFDSRGPIFPLALLVTAAP
jgi:hypothetical protein